MVNGEVVANDVSFPFDLSAIALSNEPEGTTVDVQVRANDTGGNSSLSNLLTFDIVPDTFAPEVTSTTPKADSRRRGINGISVRFNEGIDADLVTLAGVTLTNLGEDGVLGGGDDIVVTPQDVQVSESGRTLFVIPPDDTEFTPGNYQLRLDPSIISDRAGNALESAFTLNFTKRSESDPITLGETITDTFFAEDEDQIFTFTGTAGQRIYFDGISGNFSVDASLVSPSGVNLFSFQNVNSDRAPVTLIENGTYQLFITSSSTTNEDYSFRLLDATGDELALDTFTEGTLDPGTTTDIFSFEATAGDKFYLDGQGDTFNGTYTIYNQVNQFVTNGTFGFDREFTVTANGTYLLALQGSGTEAIDYSFNLINPETSATEDLTIGETITGNISEPGEEELYTFSGTVGQTIYFDGISSESGINASLISPSGQNILFSSLVGSDRAPVTLRENGTYQLKVDGSSANTGDYSFRVLDVADVAELTLDTLTTGNLPDDTNTDLFSFTASAGDKFYLDGQGDTFNGAYRIYNQVNQQITAATFGFDTEFTVTADGTYLFVARGSGTEAVDYSFNLITTEDTVIEELTIGETITGNISEPGEEELYTFSGTVGQTIYFDGISSESGINASLISPSGQNILFSSLVGSDRAPVTLRENGTYELKIDGSSANKGDYSFRILDLANAVEFDLDETVTGNLDSRTSDIFQFEALAGQTLSLDGMGTQFNGSYSIYNSGDRFITSQTFGFDRQFTITNDGTYFFLAQSSNDEAIDYSFQITQVSFEEPPAIVSTPLTLGATVTGTIAEADEEDIYPFTVSSGQRIYFDGIESDSSINASLISPSGENVFFSSNVRSDGAPVTLIENGTYQLKIDGSGAATGDYSFRVLDVANAVELTLDELTIGTLADATNTDLFKFTATEGDKFYLDGQGDTFNGTYIIYNQVNQSIVSQTFGFDREFTVTAEGNYLLALQGSGTEALDYSFNLITPETTTETLTIGETVTDNISELGEEDIYTFNGSVGQTIYFDGISGESGINVSLISPSGQNVLFSSFVGNDRPPVTLIENGTYELKVDGSGIATEDYSFRILDLADATELTLDTVITDNLANGRNTNLFMFTASAGDKFYLDELSDPSFRVSYAFYNQANQLITSSSSDRELTVTTDGTYILAALGSDTEALDYSFNLIKPKVNTQTLNLGETVTGNITEAGEEDVYTFTADAGQTLYFDGLTGTASIDVWYIEAPEAD